MSEAVDRLIVNKRELAAKVLKCSVPTLDALLERFGDRFPVEQRGSNGVEWQFDASAVQDFLAAAREAEAKAAQERSELFKQFSLPIDDAAPDEALGLTPSQRASLANARLVERKLAIESGFLTETAEVRQRGTQAVGRLAKFLDALPSQICRELGLPDEVRHRMRQLTDDARRAFVRDLAPLLADALADPADDPEPEPAPISPPLRRAAAAE